MRNVGGTRASPRSPERVFFASRLHPSGTFVTGVPASRGAGCGVCVVLDGVDDAQ
jgi:hypothetical protein